jgi:hypothetical protein
VAVAVCLFQVFAVEGTACTGGDKSLLSVESAQPFVDAEILAGQLNRALDDFDEIWMDAV